MGIAVSAQIRAETKWLREKNIPTSPEWSGPMNTHLAEHVRTESIDCTHVALAMAGTARCDCPKSGKSPKGK